MSNGCKFKLVPQLVANFKDDGITFCSSNETYIQNNNDRNEIYSKYYKKSDMKYLKPVKEHTIYLFGFIPVCKIKHYFEHSEFLILGIPVFKTFLRNKRKMIFLFFIPLLKIK